MRKYAAHLAAVSWSVHSSSLATERTHIPHRDVKLRNLLGRQYLLSGLNPRHLAVLILQGYSIGDRLMKQPPRVRIWRGWRLHLGRVKPPMSGSSPRGNQIRTAEA
jgi:hypothetical protein